MNFHPVHPLGPVQDPLGCTTVDAMCHDLYKKPFVWYLVKCHLKVQVDEVHCFVVTLVVGVNDRGKEAKQACYAAALVSVAMLRVTYQVVALKVCDYLAFN